MVELYIFAHHILHLLTFILFEETYKVDMENELITKLLEGK